MRALAFGLVALCVASGCAQAPAAEGEGAEKAELSPQLKALVLDQVPTDIAHPLYIDFNGRAELLGYALEPEAKAAPGSQLSLKLYWRAGGKLEGGYVPYTELLLPDGKRVELDASSPVRQGELSPANWERGKIYVDEITATVPKDLEASRFSIVVGLKTAPIPEEPAADAAEAEKKPEKDAKKAEDTAPATFGSVYLSVISGPADSKHGGVIATLETGYTRPVAGKGVKKPASAIKRAPGAPASGKPAPAPKPQPAQPQ
jgi:hypothetical protein